MWMVLPVFVYNLNPRIGFLICPSNFNNPREVYSSHTLYRHLLIMESSGKFFPTIVILLLLVVAIEVAPAQGKECEAVSGRFQGLCIIHANCLSMCLTEGFTGGRCSGWNRNCVCTKEC
uniref:Uncharacterized protein n=1 Tax=Avena sativa TaxID=4498 RepID=A0ACD5YZF0_AVESA